METPWWSKSPKSAAPASASSSRSREPAYSDRSGKTAASSGRSGERASSAAPDREAGVGRMRRFRSERGDGSPSSGEETAFRLKRGHKKQRQVWIPSILLRSFYGDVHAAIKAYAKELALPALKEAEEESIRQKDVTILKEGCLNDVELLMDQTALHASHSSSQPGDTQEEAHFDREETNLLLKKDKKLKPCSGDHGKIAHDEGEDGYSDKKPLTVVGDEHSDKIGVHATDEDHRQEQGRARGDVQDLLFMDDETISKKTSYFRKLRKYDSPERDCPRYHNDDELIELNGQLALYRIRAYEFTVNGKVPEMDDVKLKQQYPASKLPDKYFFMHYEESLEWYFDPERCWNACFDNYQRLVLRPRGYLDWDFYCSILNTYEEDQAYVQYFEALTNATKWIEDYLGDRTIKYEKIESVAYMQSLEIAAGFPNVSPLLVSFGFSEFMYRIRSNYSHKGLDGLYFEIWKQVAIGKMSFKEALLEIHLKGMFPLRSVEIKHELENTPHRFPLKDYYDSLVADIDETASDDEVRQVFKEAVIEMASDPKHYLDYARKKLDIAKVIGLAPKGRRRGVAPQGKGDNGNGEAEVEIDH